MNPELPSNPREELELRITSLLLGELSEAEAAFVREAIASDPELQKLHDDLKQTIHLVHEATARHSELAHEESTPLKLSDEKRQQLLTAFVIPPLKPEHVQPNRERQWFVPAAAMAVVTAIIIGMWMLSGQGQRAFRTGYAQNEVMEKRMSPQVQRETNLFATQAREADGRVLTVATYSYASPGVADSPITLGPGPFGYNGTVVTTNGASDIWSQSSSVRGFYDDNYSSASRAPSALSIDSTFSVKTLPPAPKLAPPPTEIILPKSGDHSGEVRNSDGVPTQFMGVSERNMFGLKGPPDPASLVPAPPTGIFLPKSGADDGDALQLANNSGVRASNDFFAGGGQGGGGAGDFHFTTDKSQKDVVAQNGDNQWNFPTSVGQKPSGTFGFVGNVAVTAPIQEGRISSELKPAAPDVVSAASFASAVRSPLTNGDSSSDVSWYQAHEVPQRKSDGYNLNVVTLTYDTNTAIPELKDIPALGNVSGSGGTAPSYVGSPWSSQFGEAAGKRTFQDKVPVVGDLPLVGRLFRSEANISRAPEQVTNGGKMYEKEFIGYDDPGSFAPQAQSVSGGANAGLPATALLPVPRYRLTPIENPSVIVGGQGYGGGPGLVAAGTWGVADRDALEGKRAEDTLDANKAEMAGAIVGTNSLNIVGYVNAPLASSTPDGRDLGAPVNLGERYRVASQQQKDALGTPASRGRNKSANEPKSSQSAFGGGYEVVGSLDYATVQMLNAKVVEEESELKRDESAFKALTNLSREDRLKALPNIVPDPQFNELNQQLNLAQQSLVKAQKDFGPESPAVQNNKKLVDDLEKKVGDRLDGALVGLETSVAARRAGVESMRGKLAEAKATDIQRAKETRPYYDAKRELDNLITFQKILEQRLAMEKVDVTLPRTGMVTIMNPAKPPPAADPGILGQIGHALKGDYQATASVKVDRPNSDIAEFNSRGTSGVYDPYFIQTEFEAVKSEAVLTNVIKALDLTNKWKTDRNGQPLKMTDALERLRGRLVLKTVPNTMFVEIGSKSADPTEAATIANAVAEAYRDHHLEEIRRASEGGIRTLEARFEEQQKKVNQAQAKLNALREALKVPEGGVVVVVDAPLPRKPAANAPVPQPEIQTSENNFSTFSLNVSDVSFKLAAASLEKGQMPDSASIRSEEFINAFDYRDPEATAGSPVAFAWERARYPFAHNRDLLRFSLKTAAAGRQAGRPLNIVLLLDNSGSMERADRVGIIREALRVLASQLHPQDKLSVITFARTPRLVADGIAGDKAGEVAEQVSGLTPEGGTNLEDAMNLAYQTAAKHFLAGGINRVVLLTDGAANLGNVEPELLKKKVETQRQQGIALDCFGIGWEGFNDDLLEVLSRNGDGRYGFINSPAEAASEFAGQLAGALKVAASDVKVQVEFNPKRVTSYRQIGYAKHQLTKEQFRDNTVDAAEIAAQEAGNALYTVEVNPTGEGPLATVHVRYKIPGTADYREQAWDVPFNGNAIAMEQASPAMRLATSASAFSEWLAVSPYAGDVAPDALLNVLSGVPEAFGADSRPKKLEWMIRQAKSLEGK